MTLLTLITRERSSIHLPILVTALPVELVNQPKFDLIARAPRIRREFHTKQFGSYAKSEENSIPTFENGALKLQELCNWSCPFTATLASLYNLELSSWNLEVAIEASVRWQMARCN